MKKKRVIGVVRELSRITAPGSGDIDRCSRIERPICAYSKGDKPAGSASNASSAGSGGRKTGSVGYVWSAVEAVEIVEKNRNC